MTVKIDPTAKPEKTIDFHIDDGPDDAKGKTSKGIYKLEDDNNTFVFCMRPEGDRPDKYEQVGFEKSSPSSNGRSREGLPRSRAIPS